MLHSFVLKIMQIFVNISVNNHFSSNSESFCTGNKYAVDTFTLEKKKKKDLKFICKKKSAVINPFKG